MRFDPYKIGSPAWRVVSVFTMLKAIAIGKAMKLMTSIFEAIDAEPGENWVKDDVSVAFCWLEDRFTGCKLELKKLGFTELIAKAEDFE